MQLCRQCRGGEIAQCARCGGSGWISDTGRRQAGASPVTSKAPPLQHPADRQSPRRKKRRKVLSASDSPVSDEQLALRQRNREQDEAARRARQKQRQTALQERHAQELAAKRERQREAEARRKRRRLQDADRRQQEVLQRTLRPAGSQGTIVGPSTSSTTPSAKQRKAKTPHRPKRR
jgi:hypothetical protein